jgi:hypothetical protein
VRQSGRRCIRFCPVSSIMAPGPSPCVHDAEHRLPARLNRHPLDAHRLLPMLSALAIQWVLSGFAPANIALVLHGRRITQPEVWKFGSCRVSHLGVAS